MEKETVYDNHKSAAPPLTRPSSYYDNLGGLPNESNGRQAVLNDSLSGVNSNGNTIRNYSMTNGTITSAKITTPTQTVLLNTTVPQNISGKTNLATRHTPTRNSLRHSRMIVMTRTGKVHRKSLPLVMKNQRLAKILVSLLTILASALCFLAMWLLIWTPNLRTKDNPYWSAIPLLFSGIVGLILLCCCRNDCNSPSNKYSIITTKIISIILTTISGIVCIIAAGFAVNHLVSLSVMVCSPENQTNSTCFCKIVPESPHYNQTLSPLIESYHYIDLSCPDLYNILTILLVVSSVINLVASVISAWYVYLHWIGRYYQTYSKVRTKEIRKPIILTES